MANPLHIAVDLGAGSGRVVLGDVAPGVLRLDEIRRFHYPPRQVEGHLRWDFARIWAEIKAGLADAGVRARDMGRPIRSLGVCTWGVDYGLCDGAGALLEDPICYRDDRTRDAMASYFSRGGPNRDEVFARTGIQFLPFNTLFQLEAHVRAGFPAGARRLLLLPDLLNFQLCGGVAAEYTNASTTQLLDARTRSWDGELLRSLGLDPDLFPAIAFPGADLGPVSPHLAGALGLEGVRVVLPATHDTGSAVVGAPIEDGWAYISSGTWSLVGVERNDVLNGGLVARDNFTNEGGAHDTIRFLKNVMGLWLLESCRKEEAWQVGGSPTPIGTLLGAVAAHTGDPGLVFPDDARLFHPASMTAALNAQLVETGQRPSEDPVVLTKVILDSLAFRYASVIDRIEALTGRRPSGVQIVGGGSQNAYLNQATATATGLPVRAGPVEATALGNVLVQAIAAGRFTALAEARAHVRAMTPPTTFLPRRTQGWEERFRRYRAIEDRFA